MSLRRRCYAVMACLCCYLNSCALAVSTQETAAMINAGSIKSICAGRLLLDVPQSAKVRLSTTYRNITVQQAGYVGNFVQLEHETRQRAAVYDKEKMVRDADGDALDRKFGIDPEKAYAATRLLGIESDLTHSQVILGFHKKTSSDEFRVEIYRLLHGKDFNFSTENSGADRYLLTRNHLAENVSRFTPFASDEIPLRPGFCVEGGIFVDQGHPEANETFTLVLEFPEHPEIRFSIESIAIDEPDDEEPLSRRSDRDLALMRENAGPVDVLKRGKREAAGQHGYEIDISAPSDVAPGAKLQKFFWGAQGVPNDVSRPFLEVQMLVEPTEDAGNSFSSDAEAQAFWEQLLSSLRIRPDAV